MLALQEFPLIHESIATNNRDDSSSVMHFLINISTSSVFCPRNHNSGVQKLSVRSSTGRVDSIVRRQMSSDFPCDSISTEISRTASMTIKEVSRRHHAHTSRLPRTVFPDPGIGIGWSILGASCHWILAIHKFYFLLFFWNQKFYFNVSKTVRNKARKYLLDNNNKALQWVG